jgi:hypothetical protein
VRFRPTLPKIILPSSIRGLGDATAKQKPRHCHKKEEALTASPRQTRALTEWAFQARYRADADVGRAQTEREAAAQAEREKTSRLRSLRLAKETAEHASEFTSEGGRRASRELIGGDIPLPANEDEDREHALSRRRFEKMRALLARTASGQERRAPRQ